MSQRFSKKRSTLVLTGKTVELPGKIEYTVVRYHLNLPERKELRAVLETVLRSLTEAKRVNVEMDKVGMEELVNALVGMTLNQARQTIALAALKEGRFLSEAVKDILERKAQVIRESGLLEYFSVEDNCFQLGGFKTPSSGWNGPRPVSLKRLESSTYRLPGEF